MLKIKALKPEKDLALVDRMTIQNPEIDHGNSVIDIYEYFKGVAEEIPEEEKTSGYMKESDPSVKNTGIGPGDRPDFRPGAEADAASG